MQSEGGAAGAVRGALQTGALATTFTASEAPLVSSASPLTQELSNIRRLEEAGVSAIILFSLFEEQIRLESLEMDHHLFTMTGSFAEALTFFPQAGEFYLGPRGIPQAYSKSQGGGRRSHHRQSERSDPPSAFARAQYMHAIKSYQPV